MLCRFLKENDELGCRPVLFLGRILLGNVPAATLSSLCQFYYDGKRQNFDASGVLFVVCQTLRPNLLLCCLYRVATCSVSRIVYIRIK